MDENRPYHFAGVAFTIAEEQAMPSAEYRHPNYTLGASLVDRLYALMTANPGVKFSPVEINRALRTTEGARIARFLRKRLRCQPAVGGRIASEWVYGEGRKRWKVYWYRGWAA